VNRELLEKPFPPEAIKTRQGRHGKALSYVEGHQVIRRLNEALDGWSFEVVEHQILDNEVFVLGKLTTANSTKMAFGSSSLTISRDGEIVSIGDDLKAAATDALKKAASHLGVGLSLYGSENGSVRTSAPQHAGSNGQSHRAGRTGRSGRTESRSSFGPAEKRRTANGHDPVTQKQLSAIWSMGRSLDYDVDAIRSRSVEAFGDQPEHLSKRSASAFISQLSETLSSRAAS
jgi:hypothetical protein